MVTAMLATRMQMNHHSGTCLYLLISFNDENCRRTCSPSMEEENMNNRRGKGRETNTVCDSKESAEVQWAILLVRLCIEMEMGVHDAGDVVLLPGRGEEAIREDGEVLRLVEVEPISNGCDYVHDEDEPCSNIRSGEPGASKGAPEVGGDGGPVETDRSNAKATQT